MKHDLRLMRRIMVSIVANADKSIMKCPDHRQKLISLWHNPCSLPAVQVMEIQSVTQLHASGHQTEGQVLKTWAKCTPHMHELCAQGSAP